MSKPPHPSLSAAAGEREYDQTTVSLSPPRELCPMEALAHALTLRVSVSSEIIDENHTNPKRERGHHDPLGKARRGQEGR
jgi:hypothetical protein